MSKKKYNKLEEKFIRGAVREDLNRAAYLLSIPKEDAIAELTERDGSLLHNILAKAIKNNDWKTVKDFLERLLGKPKQDVHVDANVNTTNVDLEPEKLREIMKIIDGNK